MLKSGNSTRMCNWIRRNKLPRLAQRLDERRVIEDQEITHYARAPERVSWPDCPALPLVEYLGYTTRVLSPPRQELVRLGALTPHRQPLNSSKLPLEPEERLLAIE